MLPGVVNSAHEVPHQSYKGRGRVLEVDSRRQDSLEHKI